MVLKAEPLSAERERSWTGYARPELEDPLTCSNHQCLMAPESMEKGSAGGPAGTRLGFGRAKALITLRCKINQFYTVVCRLA